MCSFVINNDDNISSSTSISHINDIMYLFMSVIVRPSAKSSVI